MPTLVPFDYTQDKPTRAPPQAGRSGGDEVRSYFLQNRIPKVIIREMHEKTQYIFERSKIRPGLEDVVLEVELSQDELDCVLRAVDLQSDSEIASEAMRGSGHIRQYYTHHKIPEGYGLVGNRDIILTQLRDSRDYIVNNQDAMKVQSATVAKKLLGVSSELSNILPDKDSSNTPI